MNVKLSQYLRKTIKLTVLHPFKGLLCPLWQPQELILPSTTKLGRLELRHFYPKALPAYSKQNVKI